MAIVASSGSITNASMEGGALVPLPRFINLSRVARSQPSEYRVSNPQTRRGYRPTFEFELNYTGTITAEILILGTNYVFSNTSEEGTDEDKSVSTGVLEQNQNGNNYNGPYTDEGPKVYNDEIEFDENHSAGLPGVNLYHVSTENDCDTTESSDELDYEVFGCMSNPATVGDWTPFGTGEACSTFEMVPALCHNTNAVNYRTTHNQAVVINFSYLDTIE